MNPICSTGNGCIADLPPVNFDKCNPKVVLSEITKLYIAKVDAAPFTNVALASEWVTRLSMTTVTGNDYIRPLTIIGDKPAPTRNIKDISGGRKKTINKTHVINVTVDESTLENHEFVRLLECGNGRYKFWYETTGGLLFGGNDGIEADLILDMVLGRGVDEHQVYNGTVEWKNIFTEEYCVSPIAS